MFLSCGDALFDVFADEGPDPATVSLAARVGGSPLNVALGLARLGHQAAFLAKVSRDLFGRRIRAFMESEGIDTRFLVPTDRNTTLAAVSLGADGTPTYSFYIEGTADRSLEFQEIPAPLPGAVEALHVASYSTVVEPTASALLALIARESAARFVSYDPNVRAAIEPDLDLWRARVGELLPHCALVKASVEDLELLYPGRAPEDVLADWIGAGAAMAVVTRGVDGAIAGNGAGHRIASPGRSVAVVDTVGAGDTFQAALLAALKERSMLSRQAVAEASVETLTALVEHGIAAAAHTCARQGADLPRRADLGLPPL